MYALIAQNNLKYSKNNDIKFYKHDFLQLSKELFSFFLTYFCFLCRLCCNMRNTKNKPTTKKSIQKILIKWHKHSYFFDGNVFVSVWKNKLAEILLRIRECILPKRLQQAYGFIVFFLQKLKYKEALRSLNKQTNIFMFWQFNIKYNANMRVFVCCTIFVFS